MRKQLILDTAHDLATQVRLVEDQIEDTLAELAELQGRMIRARAAAGIATATGHEAFEKVAGAMNAIVTARGDVACAHKVLADTKSQVPGLRTVGFGDGDECPKPGVTGNLRVVA